MIVASGSSETRYSGMFREEETELCCTHEDVDTRMFTSINHPANVVIHTADTDCLIIALESERWYHHKINIWLEVRTESSNTQRYINIDQLYNEIGERFCAELPRYHPSLVVITHPPFVEREKLTL